MKRSTIPCNPIAGRFDIWGLIVRANILNWAKMCFMYCRAFFKPNFQNFFPTTLLKYSTTSWCHVLCISCTNSFLSQSPHGRIIGCLVWCSNSALRGRFVTRLIQTLSRNEKSPISLFLLGTTIQFLKLIFSWFKLSCLTKDQTLIADDRNSSTRDVSRNLGSSFKIRTIKNSKRLNCGKHSHSVVFRTNAPMDVYFSYSEAANFSSTSWCSLLKFKRTCEFVFFFQPKRTFQPNTSHKSCIADASCTQISWIL